MSGASSPRSFLFAISGAGARLLLRLHPARFRKLHAAEMRILFAERYVEERACGAWRLVKFLVRTFADLAAGILLTRRRAARQFSPPQSSQGDAMFTQFIQDVRFALRMMGKNPGFAALAIVTLALGIGASTALFSIINGVLLRPLPYDRPEELVALTEQSPRMPVMSVSYPNYSDWRTMNRAFTAMGAYRHVNVTLTGEGEAERLAAIQASASLFPALGTPPLAGRTFSEEEDRPGAAPLALLSESLWARRFQRSSAVVGQLVTLNGVPHTVIGVMPGRLLEPNRPDVFVSLGRVSEQFAIRGNFPGINARARLKPGIGVAQARQDMERIAVLLEQQYPGSNRSQRINLDSLHDFTVGRVRTALLVLFGAVGFVLLIACANVANLLLARAASHQREMAVRRALGASPWRLTRQVLTESLLLAAAAGVLGVVLAFWGVDAAIALAPNVPRLDSVRVDGRVLSYCVATVAFTALLFGLAPALAASRSNVLDALKEGSRGSAGRHRARVRSALLIAEVALSLTLLIGAGLVMNSFVRVLSVDHGVDTARVLTAQISLPGSRYQGERIPAFVTQVVERLQSAPGVQSVAAAQPLPLGSDAWFMSYRLKGHSSETSTNAPVADNYHVSPDFFRALGIPLLKGRVFGAQDSGTSQFVCIVDELFAQQNWPGQDPIGRQISIGGQALAESKTWASVVGVVGHIRPQGVESEIRPQIYLSYLQRPVSIFTVVVKTTGEPLAATNALRDAVRSVDAGVPLFSIRSMEETAARIVAERRFHMLLLGLFAALAVILAVIGIYGVMSYNVAQRTQEIGIRVALGAQPADVSRLVLGNGARLVAIGLTIGAVIALALSRVLQSMLFGVTGHDAATFATVAALLAGVSLLACWLPARRAARVSPLVALRSE